MEEDQSLLGNGSSRSNGGRNRTNVSINSEAVGNVVRRLKKSYKLKSLFVIKPIEAFNEERENRPEGSSLAERLGLIDLLGYGVGCTVGAGIYSLIGIGAGIAGNIITRRRFIMSVCHDVWYTIKRCHHS